MGEQKVLDVKKIKSYDDVPVNEKGSGDGFYPKHKLEVIDALYKKFEVKDQYEDAENIFFAFMALFISVSFLTFAFLSIFFSVDSIEFLSYFGLNTVEAQVTACVFIFAFVSILTGYVGVSSLRNSVRARRTLFRALDANVSSFKEWFKATQGESITVYAHELHRAMEKSTKRTLVAKGGARFTLSRMEGDEEKYVISYITQDVVSNKKAEVSEPVVLSGVAGERYNSVMKTFDTLSKVELSQWESLTLESLRNDMIILHTTAVELEKLGSVDNSEVLVVLDELESSVAELVEGRKKHLEQSLVSLKKFQTV